MLPYKNCFGASERLVMENLSTRSKRFGSRTTNHIDIQSCVNSQGDGCLIATCILGGHRIELKNADGRGRPKTGWNHAAQLNGALKTHRR